MEFVIPPTMRAAQVLEQGKPVQIVEVPVPEPGNGEVLVKLTLSGVCYTDVHVRDGDLAFPAQLPITIGHEGVGRVCKIGPGVKQFKIGDRVCCPCFAGSCGHCTDCLEGWGVACTQLKLSGFMTPGTLAEYYVGDANFLVLVPDGVKDESAAPICCAGVTAYKALKQSGLRAGQTVVILGAAGGLGNYAVQYALAMGLKVVGIDKGAEKIESLKKFEGITAVDVETDDCRGKVLSLTGGLGAHAAIVFASTAKATENALTLVRTRGTVIVVGLAPDPIKVDTVTLALRMITIRGSLVGTVTDLREAMDFLAEGKIASRPQIRKFEEVNSILDELAAGKAIGRTVAIISPDEISS